MAKPCSPSTHERFVPAGTGAGLRLSSGQIGFLRQMARDSRTGFMVPRFQRNRPSSEGTLALFSGPKGTGKTMAAQTVARELGFSIYRVALSQVASKYIGETEKNLARLLETAEKKKAVLLFDEADALFGKRTAVKDSHDRYANLEVSHWLERLKSYPGLVILVSNQKVEIDPQAGCYLKYILEFSLPPSAPQLKR
ncbi:MAG: ATP-binding protein [Nitrospirales bacterium]